MTPPVLLLPLLPAAAAGASAARRHARHTGAAAAATDTCAVGLASLTRLRACGRLGATAAREGSGNNEYQAKR